MKTKAKAKKVDPLFPYGRCECDGATCCAGRGPAAFEVTRGGTRMKVCTCCDLSSDADKRLLVGLTDNTADVFRDFDALGFMCIALKLAAESEKPAKVAARRKSK